MERLRTLLSRVDLMRVKNQKSRRIVELLEAEPMFYQRTGYSAAQLEVFKTAERQSKTIKVDINEYATKLENLRSSIVNGLENNYTSTQIDTILPQLLIAEKGIQERLVASQEMISQTLEVVNILRAKRGADPILESQI
ncbi:hypothetical protein [Deinococcus ruber]|uniref:Uncharacterized protein n=1 Tax=Deinococcus ruber TaxID=1848197 RepID=A0A918CQQ6_9DEIO|nr:hypothetical protein [Deinococcus ruber]GGR34073.1 hypothetical protein GCM10008957_50350 [Deinococcus ruber]